MQQLDLDILVLQSMNFVVTKYRQYKKKSNKIVIKKNKVTC